MNLSRRAFSLGLLGLGPLASLQSGDERIYNAAGIIPTVVDGTAYIVGPELGLEAFDTSSGSRLWKNDDVDILSRCTVVDGVCFAPQEDGSIVRIDADSGETQGILRPTDREDSGVYPPVVHDGICYLQTGDGLMAIDYLNDVELWTWEQYSNPDRLQLTGIPAVTDGVVVALGSETVGALDGYTGEKLWEIDYSPSRRTNAPVVAGGQVYVAAADGQLVCATLDSGDVLWEYQAEDAENIVLPVVADDTVIITGRGTRPIHNVDGVVEGIDLSGGDPQHSWTIRHGSKMFGGGTEADGTYLVGSTEAIIAVDVDDGSYEEIHDEERRYITVLLADGRLYVNISGFGGSEVRSFSLEDAPTEFGSGGYHPAFGHHDGWAERAALSVDRLELTISDDDPVVGDSIGAEVEAHLESGVEANVTDVAEITVNGNAGPVGENGSIQLNESGPVTIEAEYKDSTTSTTVDVKDREGSNGDEDGMPGAGVVVTAISLGTAAYLLSQRERNRGRSRGSR